MVVESSGQSERAYDIYSRLLKDRHIFLNDSVNQQTASIINAQLIYLDHESTDNIIFCIDSPGGSVYSGLSIIDTMNYINSDIATIGQGICASMAAVLLCCGTKGKRYALPNTTIMIHQLLSSHSGPFKDLEVQYNESERLWESLIAILCEKTGKTKKQIKDACDRDKYLSAEDAVKFGLIDKIVESRSSL